jgi:hypothetical protein
MEAEGRASIRVAQVPADLELLLLLGLFGFLLALIHAFRHGRFSLLERL